MESDDKKLVSGTYTYEIDTKCLKENILNHYDDGAFYTTQPPMPKQTHSPSPALYPYPTSIRERVVTRHLTRYADVAAGDTVEFGGYEWLVLDVYAERILVISSRLIGTRLFHNVPGQVATWETSSIRRFLNNNFYNRFQRSQRDLIVEVYLENNDNPWWGTDGGNNTYDKIFLLSVEEVVLFFGDSGMLERGKNESERRSDLVWPEKGLYWGGIHDEYSIKRLAFMHRPRKGGYEAYEWWLRTPGFRNNSQTNIMLNGAIDVFGVPPSSDLTPVGVRPALWLRIDD